MKGFRSKDGRKLFYYRHLAFKGQFRRIDGRWYLEITPTHYYTKNGYEPYKNYEEPLKRLKEMEHNSTVLGQVRTWGQLLGDRGGLELGDYPHLRFGELETFELHVGLRDKAWLPTSLQSQLNHDPAQRSLPLEDS